MYCDGSYNRLFLRGNRTVIVDRFRGGADRIHHMIKHDEDLAYEQVSQIKFEGEENYTIFYEEESTATYCADDVYFTEKNGETLPLDTDRIGTYLKSLTTLNLTDYVTYNVTEEELESYNLVTPELTITVDYTMEDEGDRKSVV